MEYEVGEAYGMHGKEWNACRVLVGKPKIKKKKVHMNWRIILKLTLKK